LSATVAMPRAPGSYGENTGNPLKIELHSRIAEALPIEETDITASIVPATRGPGVNPYASLAALMRHTCLHAAGNMRANAMRFIQIFEIAQLARHLAASDWRELLGEETPGKTWWLFPPLSMAARYVPGSVPGAVLDEVRRACPRRLRARYDDVGVCEVSWSNLRIPALPGHEWSRTPTETLHYIRSRVWPSRGSRDELANLTQTVNPHLLRLPWYGVSHAERILRWVFTRPSRVQTISVVSAAWREARS
jgi:hypothetical protein